MSKNFRKQRKTKFEIALESGFNKSKNISHQFKQIKGYTPIEYGKNYLTRK